MSRIDKVEALFRGFFGSTTGQRLLRPEAGLNAGGWGAVTEKEWEEDVEAYARSLEEDRELVRHVYSEQPRFTSRKPGVINRIGDILIEWKYTPVGVGTVLELKLCGTRARLAATLNEEFKKILELQNRQLYRFEPCDQTSVKLEAVYSVAAIRRLTSGGQRTYTSAIDLKSHIREIATEVSDALGIRSQWVLEEGVKILAYQHWFIAIV